MDWDSAAWRNIEVISLSFAIAVQRIDVSVRLTVRLVSRATFEWCLRTSPPRPGERRTGSGRSPRRRSRHSVGSDTCPLFHVAHISVGAVQKALPQPLHASQILVKTRACYVALILPCSARRDRRQLYLVDMRDNGEITIGASVNASMVMANIRWLVFAAALAQANVPQPPTNLRIVTELVSCPAGLIGALPNCFPAPPAPLASGKQWTVTYSEEFSGTALDLTKLTPCFDWNFGACTNSFNSGKERYLPSQVQVSNGTAKLVAEPSCRRTRTGPVTRVNARTRRGWCQPRDHERTTVRHTCSRLRTAISSRA